MGVSRFNKEGYYDPTPHQAVFHMDKEANRRRPLIYVCSPYAGNVEKNVENARRCCRFAVDAGAIPLAPHLLLPQFLSEATERELATRMGLVLLGKCEEIWVFGSRITNGMAVEIAKAKRWDMKIRYFTDRLEERA